MLEQQHRATADFWREYRRLPEAVQERADKQFALLASNPRHPSLQFKKIGDRGGDELWSARVTLGYRALEINGNGFLWFWIGDHSIYDSLIS